MGEGTGVVMQWPIICQACDKRSMVPTITASLRCVCGSEDVDIDIGDDESDRTELNAALAADFPAVVHHFAVDMRPRKDFPLAKRAAMPEGRTPGNMRENDADSDLINTGVPPTDDVIDQQMSKGYDEGYAAYQRDGHFTTPSMGHDAYLQGWALGQRDAASPLGSGTREASRRHPNPAVRKLAEMVKGILTTNPGMPPSQARKVAHRTLELWPQMVRGD